MADAEQLLAPASAAAAERAAAERKIQAIRGHKSIARLNNAQLRQLFDLAARHGMKPLCDEALQALTTRKTIQPAARFEAAMLASGLASDDKVAALLQTLLTVPSYRVSARYHYARALERLGRYSEAEAEYQRVISSDRGQTRYYAMWADLRLWTIQSKVRESCLPEEASAKQTGAPSAQAGALAANAGAAAAKDGDREAAKAAAQPLAAGAPPPRTLVGAAFDRDEVAEDDDPDDAAGAEEGELAELEALQKRNGPDRVSASRKAAADEAALGTNRAARRERALALLTPIAAEHAAAYPWLVRALDLIELEKFAEAADELNEAYLAWRDASGAPRLRSGLVTLMSGDAPPRRTITPAMRKGRRALDPLARRTLSEVARLLGDPGIGLRFGDFRLSDQPRAYADVVERAARKHGLDPNLLFAVMRVESIYNRRIISNAGAVGLMQIMPHTGQRIARLLGVDSFEVSDLLDPALNVEFSAWYLASLLKRFDGRLPLAIASYNGGPHNVRQWMYTSQPDMPLDAFLERIPFSQTHRYVRRVLTYYAAYRAQQNLPMTRLSVELPRPKPDDMAF